MKLAFDLVDAELLKRLGYGVALKMYARYKRKMSVAYHFGAFSERSAAPMTINGDDGDNDDAQRGHRTPGANAQYLLNEMTKRARVQTVDRSAHSHAYVAVPRSPPAAGSASPCFFVVF